LGRPCPDAALDPDDVLTPGEAAAVLKLPVKTITQLCRQGRVPGAAKVGRQWRVRRWALDVLLPRQDTWAALQAPGDAATEVPAPCGSRRHRHKAEKELTRAEVLKRLR
jgi:excisionase family DNA binding protein